MGKEKMKLAGVPETKLLSTDQKKVDNPLGLY
jgi:hypothetical protein